MLIVSKHRDYYDTAIGYGVDKSVVYKRKKEVVVEESYYVRTLEKCYVGFCGELFPVIRYRRGDNLDGAVTYHYGVTSLQAAVKAADNILDKDMSAPTHSLIWELGSPTYKRFEAWFNTKPSDEYLSLFREWNTPVFLMRVKKHYPSHTDSLSYLELSPVLKDMSFMQIKDPYTCFQDIMMYISGVLGVGENKIVEVSDEVRRDKHGFDNRSFKAAKGKTNKRGK